MTFALCFEAHRADGLVWAIKAPAGDMHDDRDWIFASRVHVGVPTHTAYSGPTGVQPRAYMFGECRDIVIRGTTAEIR